MFIQAWGSVYNPKDNTVEPKEVITNSFCAGGGVLGDGRWLNVGGNQAVTHGGVSYLLNNKFYILLILFTVNRQQ